MGRRYGPPWVVIIFSLIIFCPIGIYLVIKKLTSDRAAAVKTDNKAPVTGWLLLFAGFYFISPYFGRGAYGDGRLLLALFLICGGLVSLSAAKKGSLAGERYRRYIDAIVNHGLISVPDIAAFAQVRERRVYRDLRKMIRMGYFDHAHFDERRGEIYIYQRHAQGNADGQYEDRQYYPQDSERQYYGQSHEAQHYGQSHEAQKDRYNRYDRYEPAGDSPAQGTQAKSGALETMTTCHNCGAHNWVTPGVRNTCEFCGSPIGDPYR